MATDFGAIATRLLERARSNGLARLVTLRRLNSVPPDPTKPWIPASSPREPAPFLPGGAEPFLELEVTAVFAHPSSAQEFGIDVQVEDWVLRAQQLALIAGPTDLSTFSELIESDGSVWRVAGNHPIRPGPVLLAQVLGVSR